MGRQLSLSDQEQYVFKGMLRKTISSPITIEAIEKNNSPFEEFKRKRTIEDRMSDQDMFRPKLINKN